MNFIKPLGKNTPLILVLILCGLYFDRVNGQQGTAATLWVQFESADQTFAATFPRQPSEHLGRVPMMGGTHTQHSYTASDERAVLYAVVVQDLPGDAATNASPSQTMDGFMAGFTKGFDEQFKNQQSSLKFERQRDLTLGSHPGRQYSITDGNKTGVLRVYLVEQRAYVLMVLGGKEGDAQVNRFFTSFTLHVTVPSDKSVNGTAGTAGQSSTPTPPASNPSPSPERPKAILFDTLKSHSTGKQTGANPGTGEGSGTGRVVESGGSGVGGSTGGGGTGSNTAGGGVANTEETFKTSEVTKKAVIIERPSPGFTEESRRNEVEGVVRLRVVLSASGKVTNISVIQGLPDGLTEKAVAAAREIKFRPAQKDGRAVSQYITLEYNFNIVYKEDEVSDKPVILEKPAPTYTEEARRNKVTGTVVLSVILAKNGEVGSISIVNGLPDGLTDQAIDAARKIKFKPAADKGKPVNVERQIEYVFSLD